MAGSSRAFCSSVPYFISVGPTVHSVRNGMGKPARWTSSKKMYCSMAERPWPPNSFGQPIPSHPSTPMRRSALV
jgi:hypothetical protein